MIQVINRAFDIIEFIAQSPETPRSLGEISGALKLNSATCANILKTLVARDIIEQLGPKKGYLLGSRMYALAGNELNRQELIESATEEMNRLTAKLNENILLAVLKGNQRHVLARTFSEHELQVRTPDTKDAYNTSSGRLILAMSSDDEIERFIIQYGLPTVQVWPEACDRERFWQSVYQIRREALAIQSPRGGQVIGLAVPIYKMKRVIASLSVYLPEYRYMTCDKIMLLEELRQAAQKITKSIN